jgi:hypothetical protein
VKHIRNPRRSAGGLFDAVLRLLREITVGAVSDSLRDVVLDLLHESVGVLIRYAVAAVATLAGILLLLDGVLHALRSIPLSDAVVDSLVGGFALAGGLIVLLWTRSHRDQGS